jgi:hypothetical protein
MDTGYLVHMTDYWILPNILNSNKIIGNSFTSFSYGIPTEICNGSTAIIFNRESLENKGIEFIDIKYTKDFFKKNPDIEKYILENKSLEEAINHKLSILEFKLEQLRNHSIKIPVESKLPLIKEINKLKKLNLNQVRIDATQFKFENEVISRSPLYFAFEDVIGIILFSRTIEFYFKIPENYKLKTEYAEDYQSCILNTNSELFFRASVFNEMKKMGRSGEHDFSSFYYLASMVLCNPEMKEDIWHGVGGHIKLSEKEEFVLKNLQYASEGLRVALEHEVFFKYILDLREHDQKYEDFLYNKLIKEVGETSCKQL